MTIFMTYVEKGNEDSISQTGQTALETRARLRQLERRQHLQLELVFSKEHPKSVSMSKKPLESIPEARQGTDGLMFTLYISIGCTKLTCNGQMLYSIQGLGTTNSTAGIK